eukprot:CCRYP_002311-RA/>CCRYP_002311-RA protein AED:0.01 eAED:0.01 QI:293/1/1/1/1/1/2/3663/565
MACPTSSATEATPLSKHPATTTTSTSRTRRMTRRLRLPIALALSIAIALALLFLRDSTRRQISYTPTIRQDAVENITPQKTVMSPPSPSFYLPALNANEILRRSSNTGLRWGILGLGRIAHDFTSALVVSGCNVTAVASTSSIRAESFAQHFSIPIHYDSYEALASDPNVDIVYVATTNQNHRMPTVLMLQHGKNVLVEKPTSVRYADTKSMFEEAQKKGLFLMTNHWTRFFPLIKFLRRTFLTNGAATSDYETQDSRMKLRLKPKNHDFYLGKVLAMHGDFSFPTPLSPSDRFLNRTLGGGVTLDVGCYLIELALLAAYDHYKSTSASRRLLNNGHTMSDASTRLFPDGIDASGHGIMYNGLEFPVDVESSFTLRWGGGNYGVWNGECANSDDGDSKCETISVGGKTTKTIESTETDREKENKFTMISSFQASFRRPSTFEVEYVFEYGRVVLHGPGNCPNEMTVYEHEPYGPLKRETKVSYPLPPIKDKLSKRYGTPYYPRAEGFAYVIDAIEKCMAEKGVPGREESVKLIDGGCLELEENTIDEQLVTVQITEDVLKDMGYF